MWLKGVTVQSHHRKNPCFLKQILAHILHVAVIEHTLREHNRHPAARAEHIKCTLDKEDVSFHFVDQFALFLAEYILAQKPLVFYLSVKRRIGEKNSRIHIIK